MLETTIDQFLGGRLQIQQPKQGYRAGVDPVLLAAAIPTKASEDVLDLGCGVGVAALCLKSRVNDVNVTGLEIMPQLVDLAKKNAERNALNIRVVEGDVANLPFNLLQESFDHVMVNPPYFDRKHGIPAQNLLKESARGGCTRLPIWVETACRRVKNKGYVHFILRTERLPELLRLLPQHMGSIEVTPIVSRDGKQSELMILKARKSGKTPFQLKPQVVMHKNLQSTFGSNDYTYRISRVLRYGSSLFF